MGGATASKLVAGVDLDHPDVIKAEMDAVHAELRRIAENRRILMDLFKARRQEYIDYIGEEKMAALESTDLWNLAIEPKFTRVYVKSPESKALREMAAAWKLVHQSDDFKHAKDKELQALNNRLAASLSLTSTHGLLQQVMRERDEAIQEKENLEKNVNWRLLLQKRTL